MEDYRTKPPGLMRRLSYSRYIQRRRVVLRRQMAQLSFEELQDLEPVYVGLSTYEMIIHTDLRINMENENFCSICQQDVKRFSLIRRLNCNHYFHDSCFSNHCKFYNKCPLCRKSIIY